MRFARIDVEGCHFPVVECDGNLFDLSEYVSDLDAGALRHLIESDRINLSRLPVIDDAKARFLPPVSGIGKIICLGLNYSAHAREGGMEIPARPIFFLKATSALSGAYDPIIIPSGCKKVDWEGELAVVIGSHAKEVSESAASEHILGYTIMNDVSERHHQLEQGGQWVQGKSFDSFAPLGPYLVPSGDIPDPHDLHLQVWVNDHLKQNASTADMIFRIPRLVSYLSHLMSLHPGDVISTGTPSGIGYSRTPQEFLTGGDKVEVAISGLGSQKNLVRH